MLQTANWSMPLRVRAKAARPWETSTSGAAPPGSKYLRLTSERTTHSASWMLRSVSSRICASQPHAARTEVMLIANGQRALQQVPARGQHAGASS